MATYDLRQQVTRSSQIYDGRISELVACGLTAAPSRIVQTPRVAECPVSFECVHYTTTCLPGDSIGTTHYMVIGKVVGVHIADEVIGDDGKLDIARIKPLARLGYADYTCVEQVFPILLEDDWNDFGAIIGAYQHLAGEMLKTQTQADFTAVAYQGPAPALNDLLGGQIQFMFTEMMNALPYVGTGKLKPLSVTHGERTPWLPQVPTMTELGFSDFKVTTWYSMVLRSGTPTSIVDRLAAEVRTIVTEPAFRQRYEEVGAFTTGTTPEEMRDFVAREAARWTEVVRRVGIEPS